MPIKVQCAACGATLKAPDQADGKTLPCPKCQRPVHIYAAAAESDTTSSDFNALLGAFPSAQPNMSLGADIPPAGAPFAPQNPMAPAGMNFGAPQPPAGPGNPGAFNPQAGFNPNTSFGTPGPAPKAGGINFASPLVIVSGLAGLFVVIAGILVLCTLPMHGTQRVIGWSPARLMGTGLFFVLLGGIAVFYGWDGIKNRRLQNSAKSRLVTGVTHIEGDTAVKLGWVYVIASVIFFLAATAMIAIAGIVALVLLLD